MRCAVCGVRCAVCGVQCVRCVRCCILIQVWLSFFFRYLVRMEQLKKFLNVDARNRERGRRERTSSSGGSIESRRDSHKQSSSVRSGDAGGGGGGKAHNERIKASAPSEKDDEESKMKDGLGKWVAGRETCEGGKGCTYSSTMKAVGKLVGCEAAGQRLRTKEQASKNV